jgi:hypothetical protein
MMDEQAQTVKVTVMRDIGFTVIATPYSHCADYVIYDIVGFDQDDKPLYLNEDDPYRDPTDDLSKADVFAHGHVKWDGCSNWHFDRQDEVMIHGCGRSDLSRIGDVLARCWDMTESLVESWCW